MAMKRESSIKRMNRYVLEGPQSGAAAEEPPSDPALVMAGVCEQTKRLYSLGL